MDDSGARGGGSPNGGIRAYKLTEAERGRPTSVLRPSIRREQNEKGGGEGRAGSGFGRIPKRPRGTRAIVIPAERSRNPGMQIRQEY